MATFLWILGISLVVAFVAWRFMIPSLTAPIAEARERDDIEPVVEAIDKLKSSAQPTAYNHAIRQLWDSYDRPLAIELVKALAERHSSALISQYWLQHIQQVEPVMARKQVSREFLNAHFQPEVAASCGPVG